MCRSPPSSLSVRSLVVLLHQYCRVNSPSMSSTSFSPIFVPTTAKFARRGGGYVGASYYMNPGLRLFSGGAGDYTKPDAHMPKNEAKEVVVRGPVVVSKFNLFTWAKWIVGSALTVILPFLKGKFEGIQRIEGKVEEVVKEVEEIAEVVEKVATTVKNVMEAVADKLPANTIMKEVVEDVEHASAQVALDAHTITTITHKVEDVKQDLENLEAMIEPIVEKVIEDSKGDKLKG